MLVIEEIDDDISPGTLVHTALNLVPGHIKPTQRVHPTVFLQLKVVPRQLNLRGPLLFLLFPLLDFTVLLKDLRIFR